MQPSVNKRDVLAADKTTSLTNALNTLKGSPTLQAGGLDPAAKAGTAKAAQYAEFAGRLSDQLDQFQQTNKRRPTASEVMQIGNNLLTTVQVPGMIFGTNDRKA